MKNFINDKDYQIMRVAELYYKQGFNQQEIATLIGTSRSTVSRLLNEAKEKEIVEIHINTPVDVDYQLSTQIKERFGLKDSLVVNVGDDDNEIALAQVGYVASRFLMSIMQDEMVLGISWGKTIKKVVDAIPENNFNDVKVVQLVGSLGSGNPNIDGPELAFKLAKLFHGTYKYINSPAVVNNEIVKKALLEQPQIQETLQLIEDCTVVIHGIGSLAEKSSSMQRSGYLDEERRKKYIDSGAVGHILAQMIDTDGNEVHGFNDYVIGVPLQVLKNVKWSIGVAANSIKYKAVLATLKGGHINCLITDRATAIKLLQ